MARTRPFDEHPERYERWFDEHEAVYQSELCALHSVVPSGGRGVEIGMGSGRFAGPLGITEGVEPSRAMRELARKRGLEAHPGVAERLPFPDQAFDFALMVTTICFVDDPRASCLEIRRVLKRGGRLIIGFVDRASPLGEHYERHREESIFYRDATFFSVEEVNALLEECGFDILGTVQTVFGPLPEVREPQGFTEGHGEGGFVVVRARRR